MASSTSASYALLLWFLWFQNLPPISAQLMWTPIYVGGNSQIDLWTQEAKGCSCPWNRTDHQCACCVPDGGCHCGKNAPNRCTQCGLEEHCNHMCNVTIISSELMARSGKTFGQIKSPSLEGPDACWYTFIPSSTQRIEVQIYRLVNAGKHNGTSCVGGFLQLAGGTEPQYSPSDNQICGSNERYAPPVVFFADDGLATLLFQITEKTRRSQFLAYFSFTSINNSDGLGYQPRGGMKLQNTDCDWLYQDFACNKSEQGGDPCVLASPSYPGVYPPHRQCKYHITTSNENIQVRISFTALLLPQNCKTDYISIYQGSTTSSPLLTTLCGNQRKTLEYSGLNLLIEFRSGPQKPHFDYNGFVATLKFFEKSHTTEAPTTVTQPTVRTTMSNLILPLNETVMSTPETSGCDILISGNNTRSGHFDTREHEWHPICRLVFQGRQTDVVHVSFFNYRLRTALCKSVIEIIDNKVEDKRSIMDRICSPVVKQARDHDSRSVEQKTYLSTGSTMIITFKRPSAPLSTNEAEFLAGAYFFHDEQISGTMQPNGLCDVKFNGVNSPLAGMIDNPGTQHLYWNIDGPLSCRQQFVPSSNQSITIKVQSIEKMSKEPSCVTQCGDNGCRCVSSSPLKTIDHLVLLADNNLNIACLCGSFQSEGLPVSARTWGSLTVIYSVAHYTWTKKGFGFSASYAFNTDTICGQHIYTIHSGEITMKNLTPPENLNHFYQQSCTWTLHSNVERQLELDITSNQNRPCTAWNISIHEYSPTNNQHLGDQIHTFCSRDNHKLYLLPWKLNTVVVRLFTLSRTLPQFKIKWKSQVVRANTRFVGAPSAAPNAVSSTDYLEPNFMGLLYMLLILSKLCFWCGPSGLNR
ncbi:uncharacterized protein LOC658825 [Tribolium castaneum]|uniref:uncharacterized protein LOC658825 n=1 Tax=Tribolium castaneum TaxID=7070 RepID=UPI0030FDFE1C